MTTRSGPDPQQHVSVALPIPRASEIKLLRGTAISTTTVATLLTPTSGKRVRVVGLVIASTGTTAQILEVYFGTGASIGSVPANAIAENATGDVMTTVYPWPDGAGPVGDVDEVVSIRPVASIAETVSIEISYREE